MSEQKEAATITYIALQKGQFNGRLYEPGEQFQASEGAIKAPKNEKRKPWAIPLAEYQAEPEPTEAEIRKRAIEGLQGSDKGKGLVSSSDANQDGGDAGESDDNSEDASAGGDDVGKTGEATGDPTEGKDDVGSEQTQGKASQPTHAGKKGSKKRPQK